MARPTDYTPEILEKAREYLDNLPEDEAVHSIEGLADYIDMHRSTMYAWETEEGKEEFSDILEQVRRKQAKALVTGGLNQTFQPTITKVMLTKHGYREGIDQTTNDKDIPQPLLTHVPADYRPQQSKESHKED